MASYYALKEPTCQKSSSLGWSFKQRGGGEVIDFALVPKVDIFLIEKFINGP